MHIQFQVDIGYTTATWTKVQLDEAIISNSNFDTSTNYRYTVPSGKAGKFHIGLSFAIGITTTDFNNCIVIYFIKMEVEY